MSNRVSISDLAPTSHRGSMLTPASTVSLSPSSPAPSSSAFKRLTMVEARLFIRERIGIIWGVAFPVVLLIIIGSIPSTKHVSKSLGGLSFLVVYVPVLIAFVLAMLALNALPPVLAGYREKGVLRRLATTPVGPKRVLAAQLVVNSVVAITALVLILVVARIAFGVGLPRQALGFVVSVVLAGAALFAVGLFIAAVAPSGRVANGIGAIAFFPMMFFAGLWIPRAQMPVSLRDISDFTPLGSAVQALQDSSLGQWPHPLYLGVMVVWAVVFGAAAARLFRWE
jgi:ABC-2 type transport system permease protein